MNTYYDKDKTDYIVTQSNQLIEADYSKTALSANPLKLFKLVVAMLSPRDEHLRLINIKLPVYKQYMGYKPNAPYGRLYKDLEVHCEALNQQAIKVVDANGKVINAFAISSWAINHKTDELEIEISGQLKPHLLQLKSNFTSYQLSNIPRLKSSYTIRLYELLCAHRGLGKRVFELDELKSKVGCNYEEYGIFKRRVIQKAQRDFEQYTDLRFNFEEVKQGRKITGVIFYTYPNNPNEYNAQQLLPFLEDTLSTGWEKGRSSALFDSLQSIGVTKANLDRLIAKGWNAIQDPILRDKAEKRCRTIYDYLGEKFTLLQQSKESKNPAGFFMKAVKEDWQSPQQTRKVRAKKAANLRTQRRREYENLERLYKKKSKQLSIARAKLVQNTFAESSKDLQLIIDTVLPVGDLSRNSAVKSHLSPIENYTNSPMVAALVNQYLKKTHIGFYAEIEELEQEVERIKSQLDELKLKV